MKCLAEDSSEDFFDSSPRYAIGGWPRHIILGLGLQEQETIWDEAIMNTLVCSIENFLTFQGKRWYNAFEAATKEGKPIWLVAGLELCQVSDNNSFDCFTLNIEIRQEEHQQLQRH